MRKNSNSKNPFPAPTDFPESLLEYWLLQLTQLARRSRPPLPGVQLEKFLFHLCGKHKASLEGLWRSYNTDRKQQDRLRVTEAEYAISYVLSFHLNNLQRTFQIFKRVNQEKKLAEFLNSLGALKVLDLGAGAGAWSASLLETLTKNGVPSENISVELIDRSRFFLQVTKDSLQKIYKPQSVRTLQADLRDEKTLMVLEKIYDSCQSENKPLLLGMSYVWNEFRSAKDQKKLLQVLQEFIHAPFPVLFSLFEPGREREAFEAMELRQWLVQESMEILYPCLRSENCPMLQSGKDWCYSEVPDHGLKEWKIISQTLKLRRERLATAGYVALNEKAKELYKSFSATHSIPSGGKRLVGHPTTDESSVDLWCDGLQLSKTPSKGDVGFRGTLRR